MRVSLLRNDGTFSHPALEILLYNINQPKYIDISIILLLIRLNCKKRYNSVNLKVLNLKQIHFLRTLGLHITHSNLLKFKWNISWGHLKELYLPDECIFYDIEHYAQVIES